MSFGRVVLSSLAVAATLTACSINIGDDDGPMQSRANVFSYVTPMAAGTTLYLKTARGSITIEPSADSMLSITADARWSGPGEPLDGVQISATEVAGGTLVCGLWGERRAECTTDNYHASMNGRAGRRRLDFKVKVPAGVRLNLMGIDAHISSASSAPVVAQTVNGDVTVVTSVGPVSAETVNGDVDIRMTTLSGTDSVIAKTLNGEAWAFLPENVSATVNLAITNGSLASDFGSLAQATQGQKQLSARLGAGATPVYVKSFNGTAGLRRLDAQGRAYDMARP